MVLLIDGSLRRKTLRATCVCVFACIGGREVHDSQSGPSDQHQPINGTAYGNVTETPQRDNESY